MNKKIYGIVVAIMAISLMLTPLAIARPGAEKNNEKFVFFELVCSGEGDGEFERSWITPQNLEDPLDNKTTHFMGGGWITGDVVALTVGSETFTNETLPYNVTWTTTYDGTVIRNNDGTTKRTLIKLIDVVSLYDAENDLVGELILNLKSAIDWSTMPPGYAGTMQGYGTGVLEGVKVSGIDIGLVDPENLIFMRNGTITGWPEMITNIS